MLALKFVWGCPVDEAVLLLSIVNFSAYDVTVFGGEEGARFK